MKRIKLVFFIAIILPLTVYSQVNEVEDSLTHYLRNLKVINACLDSNLNADYRILDDPKLRDFFRQVDLNGDYKIQNSSKFKELADLLKSAERESTKACLLPIIRVLDPNANEIYRSNCMVSPRVFPFTSYCAEEPVQYLVLFYLHFTQVNPINLKQREAFSKIELTKKDCDKYYVLSQEDYALIYERYYVWLKRKLDGKKQKKNPLSGSKYRWVVEVEKMKSKIP